MIDDATIKRVAEEVGLASEFDGQMLQSIRGNFDVSQELCAFARAIEQLARAEQREADARICEVGVSMEGGKSLGKIFTYPRVAEAIRASGKENSNE